ncbi:hypothetical protein NA78x_005944 [Anatilimnocola sp. NA78]|uniref:hypothetical protein n=1 Tax=Anatilimnocola sp. NA78 TaxID=3415683 RepID=UPI003CE59BDF
MSLWLNPCLRLAPICVCLLLSGCVTSPYRRGFSSDYQEPAELLASNEPQIERGQPYPVLDGIGWVVGIPDKVILWDRRVNNHHISPETEAAIAEYLANNELLAVKVRLNQYDPGGEWRRLVANKRVGWGWRYSLGTLACLGYTIFPGRVFGGDHYNPFTNTISIYSDAPPIALHEGGHAKDFARRRWPGTYAAVYLLPVAPLWHEAVATNDALSYLEEYGTAEEQREAYRLLYPAYGTYLGGAAGDVIPTTRTGSLILYGAAVVGGHAVGRIQAARIPDPPPGTLPEDAELFE